MYNPEIAMFHDLHNTFRQVDAFEFVDAFRSAVRKTPEEIRTQMTILNQRMKDPIPSYLLAAYRGYEHALIFVETNQLIPVVKLNDTDPTVCE